jgi:hypothetical protein
MNIYSNDPANRMVSVSLSGTVYEPNSISLSGQFTNDLQDYILEISLDNYTGIVGAQMDVAVPDGLDCSAVDMVGSDRIQGLSSSITKMSEGNYRIVLFSFNNATVQGNTGKIFTLTLHASGVIEDGQYISFSNIVLSDSGGKNYASEDSASCLVEYPDVLTGDVNNDGEVDLTDVVLIFNFFMGDEPAGFIEAAADFNGDGDVDLTDVVLVFNYYMDQ